MLQAADDANGPSGQQLELGTEDGECHSLYEDEEQSDHTHASPHRRDCGWIKNSRLGSTESWHRETKEIKKSMRICEGEELIRERSFVRQ